MPQHQRMWRSGDVGRGQSRVLQPLAHLELDTTANEAVDENRATSDGRRQHAALVGEFVLRELHSERHLSGDACCFEVAVRTNKAALHLIAARRLGTQEEAAPRIKVLNRWALTILELTALGFQLFLLLVKGDA